MFIGQERIGDRGPCRSNQIKHASLDLTNHGVGRGKPADTDHGFIGQLLYKINVALLIAFAAKTRRQGVVLPVRNIDIPQIRQIRQQTDDVLGLGHFQSRIAQQLVYRKAEGNGAIVTDSLLDILQYFTGQTNSIFQAAAVFIAAMVVSA